ncbi:hypothetical protein ACFYU9_24015 [Streptomyces sp. NPDC004327]|uniref:hypothetical protein n=1 Tax=unclassified Streptomyces TaxID=2593676 RepID=UPI0036918490
MQEADWSFAIDEDEEVIPTAPPGIPENVRLAVETLIIPLGLDAEAAESYLREWRAMYREAGVGHILGTESASVERISAGEVEIRDFYGIFENCTLPVTDFEAMLEGLAAFLTNR